MNRKNFIAVSPAGELAMYKQYIPTVNAFSYKLTSKVEKIPTNFFSEPEMKNWNNNVDKQQNKEKSNFFMNTVNRSKKFMSLNRNSKKTIQKLSDNAISVFVALLSVMEKQNDCHVTIKDLSLITGLCERTVWEKLKELKEKEIVWHYTRDLCDQNCDIELGTYFINQNIVSYQNIARLQGCPCTTPVSFRRFQGFSSWIQIDAHVDTFKKLIETMKEDAESFAFWFKSLFSMNRYSVLKISNEFTSTFNVQNRTINRYIKLLNKLEFILFNNKDNSFQVNSMLAWKKGWNNSVFCSDIAGVEAKRQYTSDRWFLFKGILAQYRINNSINNQKSHREKNKQQNLSAIPAGIA